MNKRPFWIFGVVAVIGVLAIPYWAIKVRGEDSASVKAIPSGDKTAQTLFQENCGACHTLAAGGTDGVQGPNLDVLLATGAESKTVVDGVCQRVLNAVHNGIGGRMPAGILEGANAKLVANFVARNVQYVNTTSEPQPSNEVEPSQVDCSLAPSGGGATASKPSKSGKPSQPSKTAKKKPAKGGGAAAGAAPVKVAADPTGQLKFQESSLSASAGNVTFDFTNQSPIPHDFCIQQGSQDLGCTPQIQGASASKTFNGLKPGTYTFFCSVPGHEQAGMKGTLTVK